IDLRDDHRLVARERVDEAAEREADERVDQIAGDRHGGEHGRDRECVREADQQLLYHQAAKAGDIERHLLAMERERRHAEPDGHDLRDERQGHLLDLGDGLEDRDQQADHKARAQERERNLQRERHGLHGQADDDVLVHRWKLWTSDRVTRSQPSTRTNSRILNGREMKTGGSIIMPIDIRVELTTRSMTRNGRKIRKPIWNAVFSSLMMKAGIRVQVGTSARVLGRLRCARSTKSARSLSRVWRNMKSRS